MPKVTRDLAQFTQEKRADAWMSIPWADAATLDVPAVAFWPKEARAEAQRGENAESMRLICGAKTFDAFVKKTGEDPEVVASLIWELMLEEMGVPLGQFSLSSMS